VKPFEFLLGWLGIGSIMVGELGPLDPLVKRLAGR